MYLKPSPPDCQILPWQESHQYSGYQCSNYSARAYHWTRTGSSWQDGYTRQREYESNDVFDSGSEQRPVKRVGSASMEVKRLASPPRGNYPFKIGQNVFHTKFGEGRVTGLEGNDADARAQVSFKRHGVKWLQLSIAKLSAID